MTIINIYENSNSSEDIVIQEDINNELIELKSLIKELLKEHVEMKKLLLDLLDSKFNDDAVKLVSDDIVENDNSVSNRKIKNVDVKNYQKVLLNNIPLFKKSEIKSIIKNFQKEYANADSKKRKKLIKSFYTLNDMIKDLSKLNRYSLERYVLKELVDNGLVYSFRANPDNYKSLQLFYQLNDDSDNINRPIVRRNVDKKFSIPKYINELYDNLKLNADGSISFSVKNSSRVFDLNYNIYDVLYVKSMSDNPNFTMNDFKKMYNMNDSWNNKNLFKLIFNIRNNEDMNNIINAAHEVFVNPPSDLIFSEKNNILFINNVSTHIPVHQARGWCVSYMNSVKDKDVFIWELQKRFPEINADYIAIILYNNTNEELCNILKEDKDLYSFIENNPSKRKDLIMNGGLI